MSRGFILVMDSLGIGGAPDAEKFGDSGADTLGHIIEACDDGRADQAGVREGPLQIPNLERLGLTAAWRLSTGRAPLEDDGKSVSAWGAASEQSRGKDTPSGHWEMAGVPVDHEWGFFGKDEPCFPAVLTDTLIARSGVPGLLGNRHASGTQIIEQLGAEHLATGKPIVYTSGDSVFQIAAHEEVFGLERLYKMCEITRELVDDYNIGRVIARPFIGEDGHFERTGNRHDYTTPPPEPTLLDHLRAAGGTVISIGKIADIFAGMGISRAIKATGHDALWEATMDAAITAEDRSLTLTNFVDFDSHFGHRRDVVGYARALEDFDEKIPAFEAALKPGDVALLTADHGCDPTWPGSDHTRENVPVIAFGPAALPGPVGIRDSFADIGQTFAHHLGLQPLAHGHRLWSGDVKDAGVRNDR